MSAVLALERGASGAVQHPTASRTLAELIVETWSELQAHRHGECPVCGECMAPVYGARSRPSGGRCVRCLSELS